MGFGEAASQERPMVIVSPVVIVEMNMRQTGSRIADAFRGVFLADETMPNIQQ